MEKLKYKDKQIELMAKEEIQMSECKYCGYYDNQERWVDDRCIQCESKLEYCEVCCRYTQRVDLNNYCDQCFNYIEGE